MPRPQGRGRRKREMEAIENKDARQVCFTKRRQGLFKKAAELSVLCGAQVAAIAFSPAGRAYSFGNPNVDSVVGRYLSGASAPRPPPRPPREPNSELALPRSWEADVDALGLEELKAYEAEMEEFYARIGRTALDYKNAADRAKWAKRPPATAPAADATDAANARAVAMNVELQLSSSSIAEAAGPGSSTENSAAQSPARLALSPPVQNQGFGNGCGFLLLHL